MKPRQFKSTRTDYIATQAMTGNGMPYGYYLSINSDNDTYVPVFMIEGSPDWKEVKDEEEVLCPVCGKEMNIVKNSNGFGANCMNDNCWVFETNDYETEAELREALKPKSGGIVGDDQYKVTFSTVDYCGDFPVWTDEDVTAFGLYDRRHRHNSTTYNFKKWKDTRK